MQYEETMQIEARTQFAALGQNLGKFMGTVRKTLDDARLQGKDEDASTAAKLYRNVAALQYIRNEVILEELLKRDDIQDLVKALKKANKQIETAVSDTNTLLERSLKIKKMLEKITNQILNPFG